MKLLCRILVMPDGSRRSLALVSRDTSGNITVSAFTCETPDTVYVSEPLEWRQACDFLWRIEQTGCRNVLY